MTARCSNPSPIEFGKWSTIICGRNMALSKDLLLFAAFLGFFYHKEIQGQILLHPKEQELLHRKIDSMTVRCSSPPPIDAAGINKCVDEFNTLGRELWTEIIDQGQRGHDDEFRNELDAAMYKATCKQITEGISCLLELKEYFKSCGDEEGITLPYIGKAICLEHDNNLSVMRKLESAFEEDDNCTRKETVRDDFRECAIENGLEKLKREMEDTRSIVNICSLSTKVYECYNKVFQNNCPGTGSKSLEVSDEFIRSTINLANGEEEVVKEAIKSCLPEPTT